MTAPFPHNPLPGDWDYEAQQEWGYSPQGVIAHDFDDHLDRIAEQEAAQDEFFDDYDPYQDELYYD